jgi:hypothetical protein
MKRNTNTRMHRTLFSMGRSARLLTAVALAGLMTAACDVHGVSDPGALASISVTPNATMAASATLQMIAVGHDADGRVVAISPTWSIGASGGTVNATGMFTAGSVTGLFSNTVVASVGGISGSASITVTAGVLAKIVVVPNRDTLGVTASQQFVAVGADAAGNIIPFTPSWSILAGGGTVNSTGLFTAGGVAGTFTNTVQASGLGIVGAATVVEIAGSPSTIVITPNPVSLNTGVTQQFTAVGMDASGNVVPIAPVWSVIAGGGTITSGGLFTAGNTPGMFSNTVMVSSGAASSTATVTVTAGAALATMTMSPNAVTVPILNNQTFTAVGRDAGGNVVAVTPAWSVVAGGGSIDPVTGVFTAGNITGTYTSTIKATAGGISCFGTVIVSGAPLATIAITPTPVSVQPGATQQFVAAGKDGAGNPFLITPVWSVVNGGGSINASTGLFTAGATAGTFTATIRATSGAVSGFATVTVTAVGASLATLTITPSPVTILAAGTQQFTAVGRDGNGNIFPMTPAWSVVNGGGNIDANTGVFTAGAAAGTFATTVKVSSGAISATATVTITAVAAPLATITITPTPVSLLTGATQQFTAVGRDTNGAVVPITPVWSIANGGGSINAGTGLFTAGGVSGTFANTVKATSGVISATVTVTVSALPLASLTLSPNPATVITSATQQFTAIGRDGSGNVLSITPVWSVVNGGGSINAATGLFTAGAVAGTFANTVKASSGTISGTATVTVTAVAPPPPIVSLGAAALNGIMAGTAVTCITGGIINANVSVSPGNTVTGFGPCVITGVQHLGDAVAAQGQIDLTTAYNTLAGLPCPPANAIVANLGGTTKAAGVYCTASGIGVTGTLTLDGGGDPNASFVFQAGTSLTTAGNIVLINGAQAKNVFWQVGSSATIGTASQWQGNVLTLTSITLVDNATLNGRALARNGAVTLGTNNVITLP